MPTALEFVYDSRDLRVFRGGIIDTAMARALRLAGNRASRGLQKDSIGYASARKALPVAEIRDDQKLILPSRKQAISALQWTLYVAGRQVPVAKFPHLDTRGGFARTGRGVTVKYGPGNIGRLKSAFVARMDSGHLGVFRREKGKSRLPIQELFSSRLPAKFGGEVMTAYGDGTYRKLAKYYANGLDRELGKLKRKGSA